MCESFAGCEWRNKAVALMTTTMVDGVFLLLLPLLVISRKVIFIMAWKKKKTHVIFFSLLSPYGKRSVLLFGSNSYSSSSF